MDFKREMEEFKVMCETMSGEELTEKLERDLLESSKEIKEFIEVYKVKGGKFVTEEDIESGNVTPYPYLG